MLDTIKIAILVLDFSYSTEDFRFLGWRKRYVESGKFYWFYKEKNGSQYPYISIYTSPIGQHYIWVSVSLPAFYHRGSNAVLLTEDEVKEALYLLSIYVSEKSGIIFDADTALVWNVDFAKDYYVGEDSIRPMIGRLSKMTISRFLSGGYNETTCYFHGIGAKGKKSPRTLCLYGKKEDAIAKGFSQADIDATDGMLRSEFRYRDKRAVYRFCDTLGLPNHQAGTVFTQAVSDKVLAPIEKQILLLHEQSSTKEQIYRLIEKYGKRHTRGLISFLFIKDNFGTNFYKNESLGYSRSHYRACLKECREIGVWSLSEKSKMPIKVDDLP